MNGEEINKTWRQYHLPGCSNIHRVKRNVIFISNSTSIRHEMAKTLGALMVHKFGDLKFNDKILKAFNTIEEEVNKMGFVKSRNEIITEAVPTNRKGRRVDLVCLNTGIEYEFETSRKILKEGSFTTYI